MLPATLDRLCCPQTRKGVPCRGRLEIESGEGSLDLESGWIGCRKCSAKFPIAAGVAVLVRDVPGYFFRHAKGISKAVPEHRIPKAFRQEFRECLEALEEEHIEEDLESDRVNALYLMTHYLTVAGSSTHWWKSTPSSESPYLTEWIEKYWDRGPFLFVSRWVPPGERVVELGCGVGGLYRRLAATTREYLGIDSSFQGIRMARHLNLGASFDGELRIPGDLFSGGLTRPLGVGPRNLPGETGKHADFVVAELEALPLADGGFDGSICLNAIDMLDEPKLLPEEQARVIRPGGFAIQCAPYIWHEKVARGLRARAPKGVLDSLGAVEWMYRKAGLTIEESQAHIPWLFFKHLRQLELYSVHGFFARKSSNG